MAASYCQQVELLPRKVCCNSVFVPCHDSGDLSEEEVMVANRGN